MRMLIAAAATLIGVGLIWIIPKWLRFTAEANARREKRALERRWFKHPAE